ncbi:amino acid adenylation domain-containing protein [Flavobacterium sp. ZT3R18]|uniref:non-ribosomal peptide synthetase n=1 Tax=Flavobacterium sp. ZT3R18 TaxID=2594429 RepID=UPI001179A062|nr:non-ribosomal peptide synthetase [Flavobacterium sp. ZT3R18]TRX31758.1 amino acid adenylation domain-containing protein [Flavobacterium sp. ZT3R18]
MEKFIKNLKSLGFQLKINGQDLILLGKEGKLTPSDIKTITDRPDLTSFIKENKADIITYLKKEDFKLDRKNISSMYGLSPVQEGILFHSTYLYNTESKENTTYHTQFDVSFSSKLDVPMFKKAWQHVINNHTILRTGFIYDKVNIPIQFVNKEVEVPLRFIDLTNSTDQEKETTFKTLKDEDRFEDFSFTNPPLMRITIVKFGEDAFKMIWTKHHVLWDGWSGQVIIQEVIRAYTNLMYGNTLDAQEEDKYEDFINYIKSIDAFEEKAFWQSYMQDFSEPSLLPFCKAAHERNKGKGKYERITIDFDAQYTQKISDFSKSNHVTPNTLTQAIWAILLAKYTGFKDIVYGVTVSGRPSELNYDSKVGLYINTIPLRAKIDNSQTISDFLAMLQKTSVAARNFQHTSLSKIQQWNEIKGDCFDSLLSFTNYPSKSSDSNQKPVLEIESVNVKENNNYLLSIQPMLKDKLVIDFTFNSSIMDAAFVQMIIEHFRTAIYEIVDEKFTTIGDFKMLGSDEIIALTKTYNSSEVAYPADKNIVDIFEEKVLKTPNAIALSIDGEEMTYELLNKKANQLSGYLKDQGVGPESMVGMCINRSFEMIIGILGILKAGGAYVPVDPEYPADRINFILNDIDSKIVLVSTKSSKVIKLEDHIQQVNLDQADTFSNYPTTNLELDLPLSNLAYVIYTSGTTGVPKGVMIEHGNVVRLFFTEQPLFDFSEKDVWCLFHSYSFDFSVWEIFGALLYGGKLVIVPELVAKDTKAFAELLAQQKVTVLNQTPSAFNALQEEVTDKKQHLDVRYVIFGGEALTPGVLKPWAAQYPDCALINMYGITETTVHVTFKKIGAREISLNISDIGRPIPTMSCYILDENFDLVPMGVTGELFVSGAGVARGYLNRPELSKERFLINPFNTQERLYKTGDVAKRLSTGDIEYLGRNDKQIKIRGFRIELGEVEAALNICPYANQATVIVHEDQFYTKELVAYVVLKDDYTLDNFKEYLAESLPQYMVPTICIALDQMPLTSNGKINKKALPKVATQGTDSTGYVAPRNSNEEQLVTIWKEILDRERIGVLDNFFEYGGHSLKLTRLITRYHKEYGVKLELRDLFINKTIEEHCTLLFDAAAETKIEKIEPVAKQENYALSSGQYRMWILSQSEESNISYNMPAHLVLEGYDIPLLKKAIDAVIDRHETLRTVFKEGQNSEIRQWIRTPSEIDFKIQELDFRTEENVENAVANYMAKDALQPFQLDKGPLLRISLLQISDSKYIFYYNMHHIIGDGVSKNILKQDVLAFYNAYKNNSVPSLPVLAIQYKDFAAWQKEQLDNNAFDHHKQYWLQTLSGDRALLDLPSQKLRPKVKTSNGQTLRTLISDTETSKLAAYCKANKGTLFTGVLTVWNILFHRYTNQKDILIGSPIAGRDHVDLESQIGLYFNNMVIRNQMNSEENFDQTFEKVRDGMYENTKHQMYPFDNLLDDLKIKGDTSRNPLYDVMLSYHNTGENNSKLQFTQEETDQIVVQDERGAKLDMLINFKEIGNYLYFDINYNTDIYNDTCIKGLMHNFKNLLSQLLGNSQEKIGDIDFQKETKQNLRNLNVNKFKLVKK